MIRRLIAGALVFSFAAPAAAEVRISQIYGGGGNSGAPFDRDFVELFNAGPAPVSLAGWSLQYAAATSATWQPIALGGIVPPGGYVLVGTGGTGSHGVPLPAVDVDAGVAMAASSGKLALVRDTAALAGTCPAADGIADLVGYGGANCFEGSAAVGGLGNALAAHRHDGGCADSDDNAADFEVAAPQPRNSGSDPNPCTPSPPTPSPTSSQTSTPNPSATPNPTASPTSPPIPTPTPTPSLSPTPTLTPSTSPSPTASPSSTPTPSATPNPTASPTSPPIPTPTPTPSLSPTLTPTPTPSASATPSPSSSPTPSDPACGDGVLDSGEHCDDGNRDSDDLCPSAPEHGCRFTAPGLLVHGDLRLRRERQRGCWLGWHVVAAERDPRARVPSMTCRAGAACDFDDDEDACEFRVVLCLNVQGGVGPECEPRAIRDVVVRAPRASRRHDAGNRQRLEQALRGLRAATDDGAEGHRHAPPLEATDVDLCSEPFAWRVGLDGRSRHTENLKLRGSGGDDGRQGLHARLRLTCER